MNVSSTRKHITIGLFLSIVLTFNSCRQKNPTALYDRLKGTWHIKNYYITFHNPDGTIKNDTLQTGDSTWEFRESTYVTNLNSSVLILDSAYKLWARPIIYAIDSVYLIVERIGNFDTIKASVHFTSSDKVSLNFNNDSGFFVPTTYYYEFERLK